MSLPLLRSPGDICRYLLIQLGMGTLPTNPPSAWPIYASEEPASPDNCITLYDTQGQDFGDSQIDGEKLENYGIQVRIRSANFQTGYVKAHAIAVRMDEGVSQATVSIGGRVYIVHEIKRTTQVLPIGTESPTSSRLLFTVNGIVALTRVS